MNWAIFSHETPSLVASDPPSSVFSRIPGIRIQLPTEVVIRTGTGGQPVPAIQPGLSNVATGAMSGAVVVALIVVLILVLK